MNKQELITEINKTFKNIDDNWIVSIEQYKSFLVEYNKKVNLTRLDDESKIYGSYFYDSIIPHKDVDFTKINSLLDIGSGSGIPGVVLKILYPNLKLDIIESNNKKVTFLNELAKKLGLKNINIFLKRAEAIEKNEYEKYDLVTSRAVGRLKVMLEVSTPYAKVGGLVIIPKGSNYASEACDLKSVCEKLGVKHQLISFQSLTDVHHNVFEFTKIKKTNRIYPRAWSKIIKEFE